MVQQHNESIVSQNNFPEDWKKLEERISPLSSWLEQSFAWEMFEKRTLSKKSISFLFQKQGNPIGGIRLFQGRTAMGNYLTSLGGPMWIPGEEHNVAKQLSQSIKGLRGNYLFVLIHSTPFFKVDLVGYGLKRLLPEGISFLVDLTRQETDLWLSLEKRTRGAIKKAKKNGLEVRSARNFDDWKAFHKLQLEHSRKKGFENLAYDIQTLRGLFDLSQEAKCLLQLCTKEETPLAATLWFISGKLMVLHRNAWNDTEKLNANNLLFWESILWGKKHSYLRADLGGAPLPGLGVDRGIYDFKRSWGGMQVYHHRYYQGRLYGLAFKMAKQVPGFGQIVRRLGRSMS